MRKDVQEIFRATPHEKQVMMFSATLSKEIRPVCKKFMQDVCKTFQKKLLGLGFLSKTTFSDPRSRRRIEETTIILLAILGVIFKIISCSCSYFLLELGVLKLFREIDSFHFTRKEEERRRRRRVEEQERRKMGGWWGNFRGEQPTPPEIVLGMSR